MFSRMKTVVAMLAVASLFNVFGANAMAAGSLAIEGNQGSRYGFSYDYANTTDADRRALQECGSSCRVVLRFNTGCGAYAADQTQGSTIYGWGTAPNGPAAQSRAMSECQARGGSSCLVRVWGCNSN